MSAIAAECLTMTYRAPVRPPGLRAALSSLIRRELRDVEAVRDLSFTVDTGEMVGFIGPNGAGKTTTLKMLSGILHPTGGDARVLGFQPWQRTHGFLRRIAMIRGSRPLSAPGELTVLDALRFQKLVYQVSDPDFRRNIDELTEMFDLAPLLDRQVRALSLGERMRGGLACALLYRPEVIFLDEPTIGLDAVATGAIRRFIADYRENTGATILLTSHAMADVEHLCRRVILIDHGTVAYDGNLNELTRRLSPYKLVTITLPNGLRPDLKHLGEVVETEAGRAAFRVPRTTVAAVTTRLLAEFPVADLTVSDAPLETIVAQLYREGHAA